MLINWKDTIETHVCPNCYLCGTRGVVLFESLVDRLYNVPGKWNIVKCPNVECGLLWIDPMPELEDIPKLYKQYYTHTINKALPNYLVNLYERAREGILSSSYGYRGATNSMFWQVLGRVLALVPYLRERIGGTVMWLEASQRGRLLDVGCGDGKLLHRLHKLGWNVVGIEPDSNAAELVRASLGLDVHGCSLEQAAFPAATFDVITMHHVIEHLPDPIGTLKECLRVLRQDGRLVLVTPNTASSGSKRYGPDWYALDPPRHLHQFNPRNIKRAIISAGFCPKSIKTLARCAAQYWVNSYSIRYMFLSDNNKQRRNGLLRRGMRKTARMLKYPVYQIWASILLSANPKSGEEILVIAKKP